MDDTQKKIAQMVESMRFERNAAVPHETKIMTAALLQKLEQPVADMNKLRLRLWHAAEKNDYRSLTLDNAKSELERIHAQIGAIIKSSF